MNSEVESLLFRGQYLTDDEIDSLIETVTRLDEGGELEKSVCKAFGSTVDWRGAEE